MRTGFASARSHSRPLYDVVGTACRDSRRADPVICDDLAALLAPTSQGRYLDVGCGTGNYTIELARRGGAWDGADPSSVMLAQARRRAPAIGWHQAVAHDLPFGDATFAGVVCTNAIHYFGDLERAFREIRRVLRAGGRLVIFAGLAEQTRGYWLWNYFPEMMLRSSPFTPSEASVREALARAGFGTVERYPFWVEAGLTDLFLYAGKHRPEIYFDPVVRNNISSFRLCSPQELRRGLAALEEDLRTGYFDIVRAQYDDWGGDYSYLVTTSGASAERQSGPPGPARARPAGRSRSGRKGSS